MFLLSKVFFIFINKLKYIVKILYIVLFILFKAITNLINKILYGFTSIFLDYLFIKQTIHIKQLKNVNIIFDKYKNGLI